MLDLVGKKKIKTKRKKAENDEMTLQGKKFEKYVEN